MTSPSAILAALWALWFLSWMLAAVWTSRTVARPPLGGRLLYGVFTWAGAWLLVFHGWGRPDPRLFPLAPGAEWACVLLAGLGLAYTWWARIYLGRLWSGEVTLKQGHRIVRSGPYALTRHPIYTGLLLALTATAIVRGDMYAVLGWVLIVTGFVLKLKLEERLLTEHFGEEYREYRAKVRALIPGIW